MQAFIGWWIGFIATAIFSVILKIAFDFKIDSDVGAGIGVLFGLFTAGVSSTQGAKKTFTQVFLFLFFTAISVALLNFLIGLFPEPIVETVKDAASASKNIIKGDTYVQKGAILALGILVAYVLSHIKWFSKFIDDVLGGWIILISIPASGYYVYTIEGFSFWSVVHTLGLIFYVLVVLMASIGFNFDGTEAESSPEPTPMPIPEPTPTPEPVIEQPKDTNVYKTCVNCNTQHTNPTDALCGNCGKDMNVKYADLYKQCNNCGSEYENTESSCTICGSIQ